MNEQIKTKTVEAADLYEAASECFVFTALLFRDREQVPKEKLIEWLNRTHAQVEAMESTGFATLNDLYGNMTDSEWYRCRPNADRAALLTLLTYLKQSRGGK